jgi:HAMP domain-containing protein
MNMDQYVVGLISLAGVLLGGAISFGIQRLTLRSAERAETLRQNFALAEARYTERVAVIDRFLGCAQDAERVAFDRHQGGVDGVDWRRRADTEMDRLYVAEKMVSILCSDELHDAAHIFIKLISEAIRYELGNFDVSSHLMTARADFLSAARQELERLHAS